MQMDRICNHSELIYIYQNANLLFIYFIKMYWLNDSYQKWIDGCVIQEFFSHILVLRKAQLSKWLNILPYSRMYMYEVNSPFLGAHFNHKVMMLYAVGDSFALHIG